LNHPEKKDILNKYIQYILHTYLSGNISQSLNMLNNNLTDLLVLSMEMEYPDEDTRQETRT